MTRRLGEPDLLADHEAYGKVAKERADLEETVRTFRRHEKLREEILGSREVLRDTADAELQGLA